MLGDRPQSPGASVRAQVGRKGRVSSSASMNRNSAGRTVAAPRPRPGRGWGRRARRLRRASHAARARAPRVPSPSATHSSAMSRHTAPRKAMSSSVACSLRASTLGSSVSTTSACGTPATKAGAATVQAPGAGCCPASHWPPGVRTARAMISRLCACSAAACAGTPTSSCAGTPTSSARATSAALERATARALASWSGWMLACPAAVACQPIQASAKPSPSAAAAASTPRSPPGTGSGPAWRRSLRTRAQHNPPKAPHHSNNAGHTACQTASCRCCCALRSAWSS